MKSNVIRYDVYDSKDRWMGSYSTQLKSPNQPSAYEMARINWKQTQGKVLAILSCGLQEEVIASPVIKK
jgi:hypothetical protein